MRASCRQFKNLIAEGTEKWRRGRREKHWDWLAIFLTVDDGLFHVAVAAGFFADAGGAAQLGESGFQILSEEGDALALGA